MDKNIAPTKSNLIKIKDDLEFAKLGYDLLDQKKSILISELLSMVDQATLIQEKVESSLTRCYSDLKDTVISMGRLRTANLSGSITIRTSLNIKEKKVMGVHLPKVETKIEGEGPYFSPESTTLLVEQTVDSYKEALTYIASLAELKISITKLSKEIKKTIKKVNALEKIVIPNHIETVKYLQQRLEEEERESFVILKSVKKNLEKINKGL